MHTSTDRILTTHAGSIPRGEPLGQMLIDEEAGKPVGNSVLESNIGLRVSHVLQKQAEAGIDIINDGEQGRVGFQTYVTQRMSGFGGVSKRPYGREFIEYPQFTRRMMERLGKISKVFDAPEAIADIKYRDTALINAEIERLTKCRREAARHRVLHERDLARDPCYDHAQRALCITRGLS